MKALHLAPVSPSAVFELVAHAPRVLVQFAALAALVGITNGCVSAKRYDQTESAAQAHAEGRQEEQIRRRAAEQRVAELSAALERQRAAVEQQQATLASSNLETTVARKERDTAAELIGQLQSDLARAGDHLAWFSSEKRDLGKALLLAEQRMDDVERASGALGELLGASRDLALVLGDGGSMGELELGARDGRVQLAVPVAQLFADDSSALVVTAAPILAGLARVAGAHEPLRVVVLAPGDSALHQERAKALKQALTERGVAEARCSVDLTAGSEPAAVAAAATAADAGSSEDDAEGMADDVPAADAVTDAEAAPASQPQEPYVFALSP